MTKMTQTTNFSKTEICSLTNIMMHTVQYSRSPSKEHALTRLVGLAEQNGVADDLPAVLEAQSFKTAQEAAKALHKKMIRPASKKAEKKAAKVSKMDELIAKAERHNAEAKITPEGYEHAVITTDERRQAGSPKAKKVATNPRINEGYDHVAAERNGDVRQISTGDERTETHAIVEIDGTKFKAADLRRGWTKTAKGVYHKTIGDYRFDLNGKTATLTGPKGTATGEAPKFYDACRAAEAAYNAL